MRIVIDLQGMQNDSRYRGIGRYSRALVKHLIAEALPEHDILLACSAAFPESLRMIFDEFGELIGRDSIRLWKPACPARFGNSGNDCRRVASELIREAFFTSLNPDVVLITSLFEGVGDDVVTSIGTFADNLPVAVILYDFIPYLYPAQYLGNERLKTWYGTKLQFLKKARRLLAISESARREAIDLFDWNPVQVVTISSAVDSATLLANVSSESSVRLRYGINLPFLLYVGAADPRKNVLGLIQAFSLLKPEVRQTHQLVLAGPVSEHEMRMLQKQVKLCCLSFNQVLVLGHVPDADLAGLYHAAQACVLPSFHEGFGLPVLEAYACGTPVIGSNRSSVPEAVGLDDALFDPDDLPGLALFIERILLDEQFRSYLRKHGIEHGMKFSWERVAQQALKALEECVDTAQVSGCDMQELIVERLIVQLGKIMATMNGSRFDFVCIAEAVDVTFGQGIQQGERC